MNLSYFRYECKLTKTASNPSSYFILFVHELVYIILSSKSYLLFSFYFNSTLAFTLTVSGVLFIFSFYNFMFKLGACNLTCFVYRMFAEFWKSDFTWNSKSLTAEKPVDVVVVPRPPHLLREPPLRAVIYPPVCPSPHAPFHAHHLNLSNYLLHRFNHLLYFTPTLSLLHPYLSQDTSVRSFSVATGLVKRGWYFLRFRVGKTDSHRARPLVRLPCPHRCHDG